MKKPVEVSVKDFETILEQYLDAESTINYALKIVGHPGVGKSAVVKQVALRKNYYFIDTRLAFKENVDLGGYPVPDNHEKRMIYYRPRFIPPEDVPEKYNGILWFLDEANRAHPTVIQTLFQIITEHMCGEHALPEKTSIVLAGNLGELDNTTITDFDDSALDGRLAIFHLKPSTDEWLEWAYATGIHPAVTRYITLFPERLWDERNINPNPRGWHQVSETLFRSYQLTTVEEFITYLESDERSVLEKVIISLVGEIAGSDFTAQFTSPRSIGTHDILSGNNEKLEMLKSDDISAEDLLWALSGSLDYLREKNILKQGQLNHDDLVELKNVLTFTGYARADARMSFFYIMVRDCGLFTSVPDALRLIEDDDTRELLKERFGKLLEV